MTKICHFVKKYLWFGLVLDYIGPCQFMSQYSEEYTPLPSPPQVCQNRKWYEARIWLNTYRTRSLFLFEIFAPLINSPFTLFVQLEMPLGPSQVWNYVRIPFNIEIKSAILNQDLLKCIIWKRMLNMALSHHKRELNNVILSANLIFSTHIQIILLYRVFFLLCAVFDRASCLHFLSDLVHRPLIFTGR